MKKYAVPGSVVPGATKAIDPDTKLPMYNAKGRPIWDMTKAVMSTKAVHNAVIKRGKKFVREKVEVPVYRSLSAQDARYIRAQIRRAKRKEAEAKARKEAENGTE